MLFLVQAHTRKNCLCSYFPSSSKLVLRRAWGKAGTCTSVLARQDKTQATGVHPHVTQALIYAPECWEHVNKTKNPNELVQGVLDRHLPVNQSVFTSPPAAPAWDASTFTAPRFNFPKSVQLTSCRSLSTVTFCKVCKNLKSRAGNKDSSLRLTEEEITRGLSTPPQLRLQRAMAAHAPAVHKVPAQEQTRALAFPVSHGQTDQMLLPPVKKEKITSYLHCPVLQGSS